MLTYNMDVEERSTWLRATPGAAALAQPFYCTEAGNSRFMQRKPDCFMGVPTLPQPVQTRKVTSFFIPWPGLA